MSGFVTLLQFKKKCLSKTIHFLTPCVSPLARKETAGDCLMTARSCIKYTAAGGKWGDSGFGF